MGNKKINENWELVYQYVNSNDVKHCSFDFWNTIAFSNTVFKKKRAELVSGLLKNNVCFLDVNEAFAKIGTAYNIHQESGMELISPNALLEKVIQELNFSINHDSLADLKNEIDHLFLENPPSIDASALVVIDAIINSGKTCSVTSNTAFVSGDIIKAFLSKTQLFKKFSFLLFSNEVGYGKPCSKMYEQLFFNAQKVQPQLKKSEILHIGDNEKADYKGALENGLKAYLINFKPYTLHERYAVHAINDTSLVPFLPDEYSRFKFGDTLIAEKFGKELFEYFKNNLLPELINMQLNFLIFSSPYAQIPTSSYYLTESFYAAFSNYLSKYKINHITLNFGKIRRCQTYTEDYGSLSAEDRFNLIKNDTYEFVTMPSVRDICIFIDDISITGSHQRVVEKLLDKCFIKTKSVFLYYAKLNNPTIAPSFENTLNYHFTSNVKKVTDIILSDTYKITTRTTKYILSLKTKELDYLISKLMKMQKKTILMELVTMADANEYNDIELYKQNLKKLKRSI